MAAFQSRRIEGVWFRHVPAKKPLLGRPVPPADGRWQRGEVAEGFYLADTAATTWGEWYRWLAELEIPPQAALPRDLWTVEVDVEVADLSTPALLESFGVPPPTPDRRSWATYQDLGERAHVEGWPGLVAPSAARPDGLVLCLFWRGPTLDGVKPVPPPDRWEEPPAPPRGLVT